MQPTNEAFRLAMRRFAATVSIISCADEGRWYGMSATAVTSVCIDPPALLVCVNGAAATHDAINRSRQFCVNVLRSGHADLSRVFSGRLKGDVRFRVGDWREDPDGVPFLADAQANLFCEVEQATRYQSHTIFVGRVRSARTAESVDALLYQDGRYSIASALPAAFPG